MLVAIYSRKSKWTGKGESVENQILMCKEYLTHVLHLTKEAKIREYVDEGFSGKNTKRPAFIKMLADMEEEHFDYLVCYKLDRLGRNLLDLTLLMEQLEKENTSFISIKERFDTTTPIGKAMLYFSGVLAQMEREQIGERVRDNMVMLARSGRWLGGNTPLGFEAVKIEVQEGEKKKTHSRLKPVKAQQRIVEQIFSLFLETGSLNRTVKRLTGEGILNRNGHPFTVMGVRDILVNPVYCCCNQESCRFYRLLGCQLAIEGGAGKRGRGFMAYGKTSSRKYKNQQNDYSGWILSEGRHKGLIPAGKFIQVQNLLSENKSKKSSFRQNRNRTALCSGLLYCSCGQLMRPKYYPAKAGESGENREFFYLCRGKEESKGKSCCQKNERGRELDERVWKEVKARIGKQEVGEDTPKEAEEIEKKRRIMKKYVKKIEIMPDGLSLKFMDSFHDTTIPFPQPLGPTIAMNSPGNTEKEISSNTLVSP
ncbi:MAG: recombinase family protein [Lachnospiraceae bacterium]|nr:recombinase family protein [Lachnospiraceae bacterium]